MPVMILVIAKYVIQIIVVIPYVISYYVPVIGRYFVINMMQTIFALELKSNLELLSYS